MSISVHIIRMLLLLLCLPSGGILLFKIYGIDEMYNSVIYLFTPTLLLFAIVWLSLILRKSQLTELILVGVLGGLLGTLAYDIVRIPFYLMGNKIFMPIRMYGVWLTDASGSNAFTDLIGWLYHFSNGISFGIMYALVMSKQKIAWAITYALMLETIFVLSPFGDLFGLRSNPVALIAAYLGHVAYGYPLWLATRSPDSTIGAVKFFRRPLGVFSLSLGLAVIFLFFSTRKSRQHFDNRFIINDHAFLPSILRLRPGESMQISNESGRQQEFLVSSTKDIFSLDKGKDTIINWKKAGIFHFQVRDNAQIEGGFLLYEPVENYQ